MAWEWLHPVGTTVGAMITAGFGGWFGGRRSRKDQEAQHRFEREQALTEHGRDKVDAAISALRFLQRHTHELIGGDFLLTGAEPNEIATQYERLTQAIPYLTDTATRNDIDLVREIIGDGMFERYSGPRAAHSAVWQAGRLGREALGRYLRGDPWEQSEELSQLRRDHADYTQIYIEEMDAIADAEKQWRGEQAAARRREQRQRRKPKRDNERPSGD